MGKIAELEQALADVQARVRELIQLNHTLLGQMAPIEHDETARLDPEQITRLAALKEALEAARNERRKLERERLPEIRQELQDARNERYELNEAIERDTAFWSRYFPFEAELSELSKRVAEIATATGDGDLNEMRGQLFGLSVIIRRHRHGLEAAQKQLQNY